MGFKKYFWKFVLAVIGIFLLSVFIFGPSLLDAKINRLGEAPHIRVSDRAHRLHRSLRIVDLHADSLLWNRDLLLRNGRGHLDLPRLQDGNVAIQAFTVVTKVPIGPHLERNNPNSDMITALAILNLWTPQSWNSLPERAIYQAGKLSDFSSRSNGKLIILRSKNDLTGFLQKRKSGDNCIASFLGIEGAHALGGDLQNVDRFYDAGIRMIAPTHFFDNDIAASAHGLADTGLSEKGRRMIGLMHSKHMILDLAHASSKTIDDALEICDSAVLVSHTGVKGICNNPRNLSDRQITAIASKGGIIGIGFWPTAVCGNNERAIARSIKYAASKIGSNHVALGSDYDGATKAAFDCSKLELLTQALMDEGMSDEEIRQVMGENAIEFLSRSLPD